MTHPLVLQLRFTRSEWLRALDGVTEAEARRRFLPMNCISWIIGHLTWQEQRYWLTYAQGQTPLPDLNERVANGRPASTPPLAEMLAAWQTITQAADPFLEAISTEKLQQRIAIGAWETTIGSLMLRVNYHYYSIYGFA
jgi:hypothetical protein